MYFFMNIFLCIIYLKNNLMAKKFLGWDCANKTLAWSYFSIDTAFNSKLEAVTQKIELLKSEYMRKYGSYTLALEDENFRDMLKFMIDTVNYLIDNYINFISVGVVDILNGKKICDTTETERAHALYIFLSTHPYLRQVTDTQVIIERQPRKIGFKTNIDAHCISSQLLFYYINNNPIMVDPKLKNTISFADHLTFEKIL